MKEKKKQTQELSEEEQYKLVPDVQKEIKKEPYIRLNLKPEVEEKIAKLIMEQVEDAETNPERKAFIEHCEYCRKRYTMEDLEKEYPWQGASRRRSGGTTIAVDKLMPRIKKALFYSGHIVRMLPEGETTEEDAKLQEKWLDSVIREKLKLEEKSGKWLYDAIMLNFGVLKNTWFSDRKKKEEIVSYESAEELLRNYPDAIEKYPQCVLQLTGYDTIENLITDFPDGQGLPVSGSKITLREMYWDVQEGGKIERVDPKDIIFPKGITDEQDSWLIIQRLEMRRDELKRKGKDNFFDNVDKIFAEEDLKDYGKKYDIYEAILHYDIDGDGLEEKCVYWVTKGNEGKTIFLRGIKFPYTHDEDYFVVVRSDECRYGLYSGGMGAKLKSVNQSEDRRVNQISNAWDQAICKAWVRNKVPNSPFDPRKHKLYPSAIITTAEGEDLRELRMGDIPSSSLSLLEDNRREEELLSGVPVHLMSGQVTPKDPNAPASKSERLLAEAGIGVGEYLKKIIPAIKQIALQTQSNYYQFTDTTEVNFRADKGFEKISKQQIRSKVALTCRSAVESISATDRAQSFLALLGAIAQYPIVAENLSFQEFLLKAIVTNWDESLARNEDKLFPEGIGLLIKQQIEQARALAEREKQIEEYKKQRTEEGAPKELIQKELQQIAGGEQGAINAG